MTAFTVRMGVRNPTAAANVVARIVDAVETLDDHPDKGRAGRLAKSRKLVIPNLHYIVARRVSAEGVEVLTVLHASQQWPQEL